MEGKNDFRSWDENVEDFNYFVDGSYEDSNGQLIDDDCFDWENAEQYTHVNDRDDNKTYEGSIVSLSSDEGEFEDVVVKRDRFHSGFSVTFKNDYSQVISDIMFASRNAKIIGHIHEKGFSKFKENEYEKCYY